MQAHASPIEDDGGFARSALRPQTHEAFPAAASSPPPDAAATASEAALAAAEPAVAPPAEPAAPSWTAGFLAAGPAEAAAGADVDLQTEATRFAAAAGLSALYGVALGVREGGAAIVRHALGVPAALLAVAGLGVPALYILLALFDAPLEPPRVAASASRAAASAGLLLAGLAPAAALFVVSSEGADGAALVGAAGLVLGGLAGISRLLHELGRGLGGASEVARAASGISFAAFALFATALAARVWWSTLPILRGAL